MEAQQQIHLQQLGALAVRIYQEQFYRHACDGIMREETARRRAYLEACAAVGEKPLEATDG
jgi:predicted HicB family RNase H-like nuclease